MFKCEQCGPINCAYLDGYRVGDRLLEGVTFIIRHTGFDYTVETHPDSKDYMTLLNEPLWLNRAKERANTTDTLRCPKCRDDVENDPNP